MNISEPFIRKPIATTLLTIAVTLAGMLAFRVLPVSPLPQIDFPTIQVSAGLTGASPETMASSVATPLERQFARIAGITEMTSQSNVGSTSVTLQFDLNRNVDAAARDVEAAINAARSNLPQDLPINPTYRKVNPADAPILIIALTSDTLDKASMYDAASTILQQKLAQVSGIGQVIVGGSSLPGVRVEVNPTVLNKYGIGLEDVRTALASANANMPKGQFADNHRVWNIGTNDQLFKAVDYQPLIVAYRNGAPVRVADIAEVRDSVEDLRNAGYANGKPSVLLILFRQPGANIIGTVDRVLALIPRLQASIPQAIKLSVVLNQTVTIRASVREVERALMISVVLVILVVFVFLRNIRATCIPGIAVPVSLIGTFGVMYLFGYSIDNLSLMALTVSTGFVVDDAIVVLENITRYVEQGMSSLEATKRGAKEIGFTVLSMSLSLIAVFIPLLLMGGIVGRLFREFAITLSAAISVSLIVSLTTTPMMCAKLLKRQELDSHGRLYRASESIFNGVLRGYERSLKVVLRHSFITFLVAVFTVALNIWLFMYVRKGFFPEQDTGRLNGSIQADQSTSFQAMQKRLLQMITIVLADRAVDTVTGFTGGGTLNTARLFISLKPLEQRKVSVGTVIARLRPKLVKIPGATLYLQATQDLRIGGRMSNAAYQFTMQSDNLDELIAWAPRMLQQMHTIPIIADVNSDQQNKGLQEVLEYDRNSATRLGISSQVIDSTLYDAFGQRQVSTIYTRLNQYHVVMEVAPPFWQSVQSLGDIYVRSSNGTEVPLSAFTHYASATAPLAVNHQGQFPAITISFNLTPNVALGDAVKAIEAEEKKVGLPPTVHGTFQGTARAFQDSLQNEWLLIVTALASVYIVLGILYESYIHPITILSTLPSAGVGAVLALMLCNTELSIIAVIGVILLIGIVKKNAIMMVDFALAAERSEKKTPRDAIYEACLLRFRPIMMTTMAALFGALPLALGTGTGSELRRPLGITIIGGLIVSQMLTLYTTPVVYLYLDRYSLWWKRFRHKDHDKKGLVGVEA